jgi:hypothetical protein
VTRTVTLQIDHDPSGSCRLVRGKLPARRVPPSHACVGNWSRNRPCDSDSAAGSARMAEPWRVRPPFCHGHGATVTVPKLETRSRPPAGDGGHGVGDLLPGPVAVSVKATVPATRRSTLSGAARQASGLVIDLRDGRADRRSPLVRFCAIISKRPGSGPDRPTAGVRDSGRGKPERCARRAAS